MKEIVILLPPKTKTAKQLSNRRTIASIISQKTSSSNLWFFNLYIQRKKVAKNQKNTFTHTHTHTFTMRPIWVTFIVVFAPSSLTPSEFHLNYLFFFNCLQWARFTAATQQNSGRLTDLSICKLVNVNRNHGRRTQPASLKWVFQFESQLFQIPIRLDFLLLLANHHKHTHTDSHQ